MSLIRSGINLSVNFLSLFSLVSSKSKHQKNKTHDYSRFISGQDYVFEILEGSIQGYMTGQGKDIKPGDYILLQKGSESYRYRVEEIDYYSNPSDMWIALLKEVVVD